MRQKYVNRDLKIDVYGKQQTAKENVKSYFEVDRLKFRTICTVLYVNIGARISRVNLLRFAVCHFTKNAQIIEGAMFMEQQKAHITKFHSSQVRRVTVLSAVTVFQTTRGL